MGVHTNKKSDAVGMIPFMEQFAIVLCSILSITPPSPDRETARA